MDRSGQRGVALVEFALILPLLLILTFITTEFGRALYEYDSVAKSVRVAARYLSTQNANSHQAQAQNLTIYGYVTPPSGATPLAPGLAGMGLCPSGTTPTSPCVGVSWSDVGSSPVIKAVTVSVHGYQFRSIFTTAFGLTFGTVNYSDIQATMRSNL
jgi:Flp pilus assembly protein TadG